MLVHGASSMIRVTVHNDTKKDITNVQVGVRRYCVFYDGKEYPCSIAGPLGGPPSLSLCDELIVKE